MAIVFKDERAPVTTQLSALAEGSTFIWAGNVYLLVENRPTTCICVDLTGASISENAPDCEVELVDLLISIKDLA